MDSEVRTGTFTKAQLRLGWGESFSRKGSTHGILNTALRYTQLTSKKPELYLRCTLVHRVGSSHSRMT